VDCKINDKLQLVGLGDTKETVATGLEMFNNFWMKPVLVKTSDSSPRLTKTDVEKRMCLVAPALVASHGV